MPGAAGVSRRWNRSEQLAGLRGQSVLDEDLVLGRDDLADGCEVPRPALGGSGEAQLAPDQPEHRSEQRGGDQKAKLASVAEQRECYSDEQPDPQPGDGTGERDLAARQAPGDALDRLEFSADDGNVLDGEAVI